MVIGVADKHDERYIIYHFLEKLLDSFNDLYNKHGELSDWDGSKNKFFEFENSIKENVVDPKFAEMSVRKPILKTYKKFEKKPGVMDKTLPKSVITQGILTQEEYDIAHLLDGSLITEEIAKKNGIPLKKLQSTLEKLDRLGLLKYIK